MLSTLSDEKGSWDILIIGGGATGLGAAVDAAVRGLKTLLLEQSDFAKGTSSRSTKLIHGGLRYLQQGHIPLVFEALKERGLLCQNAPHLIYHLPFFVPSYHWWEGPFYGVGLKVYDLLAGSLGLEPSRHLSAKEAIKAIPTLETKDLRGGTIYYDGQFDDARLAITLAKTAADLGGCLINYMKVISFLKKREKIIGVVAKDEETGKEIEINAKVVINACGPFSDAIRQLDDQTLPPIIEPSQGIHLVLDAGFLQSETALLIPHTEDGRVIFMVPWHNRVLIGTTDSHTSTIDLEPIPKEEEIDFLLHHAKQYLTKTPTRHDILSVFSGIRPLVRESDGKKTGQISRDHKIITSSSGLITIAGGKWTTYRKMAQDVIDKAVKNSQIPWVSSSTEHLKLHGYAKNVDPLDPWSVYGSDAQLLHSLLKEDPSYEKPLHPTLPYLKAEIIWAIRHEMARTLDDLLSRRTRSLLLGAEISLEIAPTVVKWLGKELQKEKTWEERELHSYKKIAMHYFI